MVEKDAMRKSRANCHERCLVAHVEGSQRSMLWIGFPSRLHAVAVLFLALSSLFWPDRFLSAQEPTASDSTVREGMIVRIPLPITGETDAQILTTIERCLKTLPVASTTEQRPVLVLEFDTLRGASGRGSQFERCVALARFLTSPEMSRVQTVAYLPGHGQEGGEVQALAGHALLVAMACEIWAFDEQAKLAIDQASEEQDELVRSTYRSIAARRQVLPTAIVDAIVDRTQGAALLDMTDGTQRYATLAEMESLEDAGQVVRSETVIEAGEAIEFDAATLARRRFVDLVVQGRADLARQLKVNGDVMLAEPALGEGWKPVLIKMDGTLDAQRVEWVIQSLRRAVAEGNNLIIVDIQGLGGSLTDAARLSQLILDLDPLEVRSVAFVEQEARGGAALLALSCDQLVMHNSAILGGVAMPPVTPADATLIDQIAEAWKSKREVSPDWVRGLVDSSRMLTRYRHSVTGEERVFTDLTYSALGEEERGTWKLVGPVETRDGLQAPQAQSFRLARHLVQSREEISSLYDLSGEIEQLEPPATHRAIARFARFISNPFVSSLLILFGMSLFFNELSTPGLGIPGALSVLCFGLYFWAHFLGGTAHWLELILFFMGVVFVMMEIFVLPGFGIFGISGVLMVIISIVLASQTFIVPTTSEDFQKIPATLALVVSMVLGAAIPMVVIPRYLDRIPLLRRLVLNPESDQAFDRVADRERLANFTHLRGKMGVAVTDLKPGGKVRFGDDDVSVVTDGRLIERGEKVIVREVYGNRVVVEASNPKT